MHRQRRKQTAEVFELELSLLQTDCPNLGAYTSQPSQLYPDSILYSFTESVKGQGTKRVKNIGGGANACLRGFNYYCLKSIYDHNNRELLDRFKQQLYPNQRNLTAVTSLPDNLMELSSSQMKKLVVEFIHVLSYSTEKNKVESYLNKYPVIQVVMLLLLRAILRDCKIQFADQFDKAVDWVEASLALGEIFGVDVRFTNKMRVCEFINKQFYVINENDNYFMVYFDQIKTERIDLNQMDFDSVSVSVPSDRQNMDKSDGSTPKFKLYIDQKHRRRSHKNSFGGEIDIKASKELSSSTIFNHDTAFGEIIRKHRLSEDSFVDAPKEKDSSKHMNKQKLSLLENELKKIRKKKRSTEKVERSSDGPRFFENNQPLDMEMPDSGVENSQNPAGDIITKAEQQFKLVLIDPEEQDDRPRHIPHTLDANNHRVFKWDERSSFSQLAGLKINEKMIEMLNLSRPNAETLSHLVAANADLDPGSPTNTTISNSPVIAFDANSYIKALSTSNHEIDNQMTCSKIIDLLEPSVRQSMKMRKLSMATELIKPNIRKIEQQIKSSLIVNQMLTKETNTGQNTFEMVMNESMINVVNQPQTTSKFITTLPSTNPPPIKVNNTTAVATNLSPSARSELKDTFTQPITTKPTSVSQMVRGQRITTQEPQVRTVVSELKSVNSNDIGQVHNTKPTSYMKSQTQSTINQSNIQIKSHPTNVQIKYSDKSSSNVPQANPQQLPIIHIGQSNTSRRSGSLLIPLQKNHNHSSALHIIGQSNNGSSQLGNINYSQGSTTSITSGGLDSPTQRQQRSFTKMIHYPTTVSSNYPATHQNISYTPNSISNSHTIISSHQTIDNIKPTSAQLPHQQSLSIQSASIFQPCFKKNYDRATINTISSQNLQKTARVPVGCTSVQFGMVKKSSGDGIERRQLVARR